MRSIYRSIATRHNLLMLGLALAVLAGWHFGYVSEQNAGLIGFLGITMNAAGARVIDPILTTVAQGYQNAEFVGMNLFPSVPHILLGKSVLMLPLCSLTFLSGLRRVTERRLFARMTR